MTTYIIGNCRFEHPNRNQNPFNALSGGGGGGGSNANRGGGKCERDDEEPPLLERDPLTSPSPRRTALPPRQGRDPQRPDGGQADMDTVVICPGQRCP